MELSNFVKINSYAFVGAASLGGPKILICGVAATFLGGGSEIRLAGRPGVRPVRGDYALGETKNMGKLFRMTWAAVGGGPYGDER